DDWCNTDNVQRAAKLPGASVVVDRGGIEAARFGATISGAIMIFDEAGNRRYAGGITPARGMQGANAGCDAALAVLQGSKTNLPNVPAFGCRLCLPHSSQPTTQCVNNICPANAKL